MEENEISWPLHVGVVLAEEYDRHQPKPEVRVAALLADSTRAKRAAVEALQREDATAAEIALASGARAFDEGANRLRDLPVSLRDRIQEERDHIQTLRDQAKVRGIQYNRRRIREDVSMNSRGRADDVRRARSRQADRRDG
jgi:hypothetical protein